jgi:tetratricopeptide (TPR) repeat protein
LPFDREDTLKKAEKLLRQGRLDAAVAEYARVVEEQPRDWNTLNTLGDLYARAGQTDKAAAAYMRIADHLFHEGFYPRAAALYKKILKIKPEEEACQLNLGEIAVKQGLLLDAKSYFGAIAERRRARGDRAGAEEMVVRLGTLDPADIEARIEAAKVLEQQGDLVLASFRHRELHGDLLEKGRKEEAFAALREAVRLNPDDREGRIELGREAVAAGDVEGIRTYLDRETVGEDPALLLALTDLELRAGALEPARELVRQLLALDRERRREIVDLAWKHAERSGDSAFICIDAAVEASIAANDYADAAGVLQEFVARVPGQIPALLKLVEVCVDGGFEATMYETQAQLADAYLEAGHAAEARVIAEDLVAREPWEHAHLDRFRKALILLNVSDPDTLIAERLSGQAPFMAKDHFADLPFESSEPAAEPPAHITATAATTEESMTPAEVVVEAVAAAQPLEAAPAAEQSKQPGGAVEIDLTRLLGDLQGTTMSASSDQPPQKENPEAAFQDFHDEVSRQTGAEEAAQHLKLARTYLDMGMPDEAIGSLQTAARSPRHRFEAASTLGRLYRDQQDLPRAIEWLERAAEAPAPGVEDGRALLYDLGATLESARETARALAVFMELQADAGAYRDVSARVERLSKVQTGS